MSSNTNILEMKEKLTKLVGEKETVTLSECLSYSTRDELVQIAVTNGYSMKKSLKKQEMVEVLVEQITNAFAKMFDGMLMDQFESVMLAMRLHQCQITPPDELFYFTNRGYVYWMATKSKKETEPTLLFPQELMQIAFSYFTEECMAAISESETIYLMLQAMCNLYGTFPIALVHRLYKQYNGEVELKEEILTNVLRPSYDRVQEFHLIGDSIVPDYLVEEDAYQTIVKQSEGMEYYIPTLEELLYYTNHEVNEDCEQYQELLTFFQRKVTDESTLAKLMTGICCLSVQDAMPSHMMSEVNNAGIIFQDVEEANQLLCLLTDFSNHTIKWAYKGNTPVAVGKLRAYPNSLVQKNIPVVKSEPKVYPNDPCPCGSGKKYKKCCGRN